ncbi:hypothetical protein [Bradyrhizobium erythrophlei]|uniref:Uncharacterized protein n=1 Tax=Bradyrhizobium erythrophlei TaxID=1437360 RepID=A0A1M5NP56_9BRAD|nr:hypothetical protein [Bradyrhizobium erythrophlei]SHG90979.1 hypothetical protein SAMN05443248_3059 [Bradyrhizobium erythrophlei]
MPYKALASDGKDGRKRKGKRTTKNSSTAPRKLVITARFREKAAEAVQYRLLGYKFQQIADEMKIDIAYAHRLVKWAKDREPVEGAAELKALMSDRLEMMLTGTLGNAFEGDSEAQEQSRRTMEIQAKLHGLYAAQKLEHSGEVAGGGTSVIVISSDDAKL